MEYTVQKLAKLAGVSARTLRYYDQIGLLHPVRTSSAGYRIYGTAQVDRLQQILFYRELGMELSQIALQLNAPNFDRIEALRIHLRALENRRHQTDLLIDTLKKTITAEERMEKMNDTEKFEGFKRTLIAENEEKYGQEIRSKYGTEAVEQSNVKLMNLSQEQYSAMQSLAERLQAQLEAAVLKGLKPESPEGCAIADMHKKWLGYTWGSYSPEAHRGLGDLYIADERFTAHYDRQVPGCATFLRDAIHSRIK